MNSFCPKFVRGFVDHVFPGLRKTQKANLALASYGMVRSGSGLMTEIARKTPGARKHKYRLKRLWRFISNHRVKPERWFDHWIVWCVKKFNSGKHVRVALDWTTLPGNIQCLMAAIPFKGRAIPLIWHICRFSDIKDSQNLKEERLVSRLINLIPESKKMVLIADRGFGRANFITFLQKKGVLFCVRVRSKAWIKTQKGYSILLKNLYLKEQTPYWFKNITYRADEIVRGVNLAAVVAKGSDDPWFLVTNLMKADTTVATYEKRFQIEEWFKDIKHQLGMSDMQTTNLKRVRRILFVSIFSYTILALIGRSAKKKKQVMETMVTGSIKETVSIITCALYAIEYKLLKAQFWKKVRMVAVAS